MDFIGCELLLTRICVKFFYTVFYTDYYCPNNSRNHFVLNLGSVSSPLCVCETRKRYVVKHNCVNEVYLMTVMETTTCFGLYCPSSVCLGNLRASYTHARARGVEISTYAYLDKPNQTRSQIKHYEVEQVVIQYT